MPFPKGSSKGVHWTFGAGRVKMASPKGCPWHGKDKNVLPEGILQRSPVDLRGGKAKHALPRESFGSERLNML